MNRKDIWNLFKITGKIEYYLKYKEMLSEGIDYIGDKEDKRNNSFRK